MDAIIKVKNEIDQSMQAIEEVEQRQLGAQRAEGPNVPDMLEGPQITVSVIWLAWMLNYVEGDRSDG